MRAANLIWISHSDQNKLLFKSLKAIHLLRDASLNEHKSEKNIMNANNH